MSLRRFSFSVVDRILIIYILICLLGMLSINLANKMLYERIQSYSENLVDRISNILISNIVNEEINKYKGVSFINNDDLASLNFDTYNLNKIQHSLLNKINSNFLDVNEIANENLDLVKTKDKLIIHIPYGLINNKVFLNWMGPNIPIGISVIGNSICNVDCNVDNYSINTIVVKIMLNIKINYQLFLPINSSEITLDYSYPLSIKLVQGEIPDTYLGSYPIISMEEK